MNYQEEIKDIGNQIADLQKKLVDTRRAQWENDTLPECEKRFGKCYKTESTNYNHTYNTYYKTFGMKPKTKYFWVEKFRSIPANPNTAASVRFDVELLNADTLIGSKAGNFEEISTQEYDDARRQAIDSLQDKSSHIKIEEANGCKIDDCCEDSGDCCES